MKLMKSSYSLKLTGDAKLWNIEVSEIAEKTFGIPLE